MRLFEPLPENLQAALRRLESAGLPPWARKDLRVIRGELERLHRSRQKESFLRGVANRNFNRLLAAFHRLYDNRGLK